MPLRKNVKKNAFQNKDVNHLGKKVQMYFEDGRFY